MEPRAEPTNSSMQQCTSCVGQQACAWCVQCDEALCDSCLSAHRRVKITKSHSIISRPPAAGVCAGFRRFCPVHPSLPLSLFCCPCKKLTCQDCQLTTHFNHRFQFSDKVFDSLKQQLDSQLQPIRAQKEAVRRSLQDMETRLQEIEEAKERLKMGLKRSFLVYTAHFHRRMSQIVEEVKTVCQVEVDWIQRRIAELKQLEEKQHLLTATAEEAKNMENLDDLLTSTSQIEAQVKELSNKETSPPATMMELKVVVDVKSYNTVFSFGNLVVTTVPFSVPPSSDDTPVATGNAQTALTFTSSYSSAAPLTSTFATPSSLPLPQKPNTGNTSNTGSAGPANHLSTFRQSSSNRTILPLSSCQSRNPSSVPVTKAQGVHHPSSAVNTNQSKLILGLLQNQSQFVSSSARQASVQSNYSPSCMQAATSSQSCAAPGLLQPSLALNQPCTAPATMASTQNQSAAGVFTNPQTVVHQTSCTWPAALALLPSAVQQHQNLLYSLPGNNYQTAGGVQQKDCGLMGNSAANSSQFNPASTNWQRPPALLSNCSKSVKSTSVIVNHSQPSQASALQMTETSAEQRSDADASVQKQPSANSMKSKPSIQTEIQKQILLRAGIVMEHWKLPGICNQSNQHQHATNTPSKTPLNKHEAVVQNNPLLSYLLIDNNKESAPFTHHQSPETQLKSTDAPTQNHLVRKSGNAHENLEALTLPHPQPVSDTNQDSASAHSRSSPPQHQQPKQIVKAVADSACDRSSLQLSEASAANRQEPGENEPTSTVSEPGTPPVLSECNNVSELITSKSVIDLTTVPSPESPPVLSECNNVSELITSKSVIDLTTVPSPESDFGHVGEDEPDVSASIKNDVEGLSRNDLPSVVLQCVSGSTQTEVANLEAEAAQEDREDVKSKPSGRGDEEQTSLGEESEWSQKQARVSLFRLPISTPPAGETFPRFRLLPGEAADEVYLQEINEDSEFYADDIMDYQVPLSSPESPAVVHIVICSACGCANGSLVCARCGRGYHRDCHVPPMGQGTWCEWVCSLCQDLRDPSDPYSSERRQRPSLDLLDQRKCEKLLLTLLVEDCADLCVTSELPSASSQLNLMSGRLALSQSPPYRTPAEFISDVWTLFQSASSQENEEVLRKLQESFQRRLLKVFGAELHPSLLKQSSQPKSTAQTPNNNSRTETEGEPERSKVSHCQTEEGDEVTDGSEVTPASNLGLAKLKETRKRLMEFLDTMGPSSAKKTITN